MSTIDFIKTHTMVTQYKDGREIESKEWEALVWISKHVKTTAHANLVKQGTPTAMIDGSMVFFKKKGGEKI